MRRIGGVALLIALGIGYPVASSAQTPASPATARTLLETMQASAMMQLMATSMIDAQIQQAPAMAPYRQVMLNWMAKYLSPEATLPEIAKLYAAAFTEAELQELIKFYRTPTGQKLLSKQAELTQQAMQVTQQLAASHKDELMQMIQARAAELQQAGSKAN